MGKLQHCKLQHWWKAYYGDLPPMGHILRQNIPDRWLRIHSLPNSKRYADSEQEYCILLHRQNTVATELLGQGKPCLIFAAHFTEDGVKSPPQPPQIEDEQFELFGFHTEPETVAVWVAKSRWNENSFDGLICAIADDREAHITFVSVETGEAYHPYDGGADLFVSTQTRRDELKNKYQSWLSEHPLGL